MRLSYWALIAVLLGFGLYKLGEHLFWALAKAG